MNYFSTNMKEWFYGNQEPTCIVRSMYEVPIYTQYMVPVVEMKVPICCSKCEIKIRKRLYHVHGVDNVICDIYNQKVTVTGNLDPKYVLKKMKRFKRRSEFYVRREECQR